MQHYSQSPLTEMNKSLIVGFGQRVFPPISFVTFPVSLERGGAKPRILNSNLTCEATFPNTQCPNTHLLLKLFHYLYVLDPNLRKFNNKGKWGLLLCWTLEAFLCLFVFFFLFSCGLHLPTLAFWLSVSSPKSSLFIWVRSRIISYHATPGPCYHSFCYYLFLQYLMTPEEEK